MSDKYRIMYKFLFFHTLSYIDHTQKMKAIKHFVELIHRDDIHNM